MDKEGEWIENLFESTNSTQKPMNLEDSTPLERESGSLSCALVWVSGTNMGCIFFNESWLKFRGRTLEEESGNGWASGVHPDDLNRCLSIYQTSFSQKKDFLMDYRLLRRDGSYRWIRDKGSPSYSSNGLFVGFIGACVEIHKDTSPYGVNLAPPPHNVRTSSSIFEQAKNQQLYQLHRYNQMQQYQQLQHQQQRERQRQQQKQQQQQQQQSVFGPYPAPTSTTTSFSRSTPTTNTHTQFVSLFQNTMSGLPPRDSPEYQVLKRSLLLEQLRLLQKEVQQPTQLPSAFPTSSPTAPTFAYASPPTSSTTTTSSLYTGDLDGASGEDIAPAPSEESPTTITDSFFATSPSLPSRVMKQRLQQRHHSESLEQASAPTPSFSSEAKLRPIPELFQNYGAISAPEPTMGPQNHLLHEALLLEQKRLIHQQMCEQQLIMHMQYQKLQNFQRLIQAGVPPPTPTTPFGVPDITARALHQAMAQHQQYQLQQLKVLSDENETLRLSMNSGGSGSSGGGRRKKGTTKRSPSPDERPKDEGSPAMSPTTIGLTSIQQVFKEHLIKRPRSDPSSSPSTLAVSIPFDSNNSNNQSSNSTPSTGSPSASSPLGSSSPRSLPPSPMDEATFGSSLEPPSQPLDSQEPTPKNDKKHSRRHQKGGGEGSSPKKKVIKPKREHKSKKNNLKMKSSHIHVRSGFEKEVKIGKPHMAEAISLENAHLFSLATSATAVGGVGGPPTIMAATPFKFKLEDGVMKAGAGGYICPYSGCGETPRSKFSFNRHLKLHAGTRPYICTYPDCAKKFLESNTLKRHARIHTGERPFVCPLQGCGKSFTDASNFKRHERSHTGEKPYKCVLEGCGRSFTRGSSLKNHLTSHHKLLANSQELLNAMQAASTLRKQMPPSSPKEKLLLAAAQQQHHSASGGSPSSTNGGSGSSHHSVMKLKKTRRERKPRKSSRQGSPPPTKSLSILSSSSSTDSISSTSSAPASTAAGSATSSPTASSGHSPVSSTHPESVATPPPTHSPESTTSSPDSTATTSPVSPSNLTLSPPAKEA